MAGSLARRVFIAGIALWAVAALAYGTLRVTFGERPAYVHVRWSQTTDAATRQEVKETFGLTRGELKEVRTWGYYLTDLSGANIRALVGHAAVEDTHYIHRTAFRVWRTAPRGSYPGSTPAWIPAVLEYLTMIVLALGAVAFGLALVHGVGPPASLQRPLAPLTAMFVAPSETVSRVGRRLLAWLESRVPAASAEALGLFRIVFGLAFLAYFVLRPVGADWIPPAVPESLLQATAIRAYEAAPWVAERVGLWIVCWSVLFIAGAAARFSFVMFAAGVLAWGLLYTSRVGSHSEQVPLVVMICLLWSRWGDAWSVDAWWRGRQGRSSRLPGGPRREYGYSMWVPGFVLGLSFAAAAFAKMRESGLAWIFNGSVKYHFLSDAHQAPVDWGLRLAQYEPLAILMSFSGVALEAFVIVGVLSTRYRYRLAGGVAALLLVTGFELFQGLFWPSWGIMLLSFLPWHLVGATARSAPVGAALSLRRPSLLHAQAGVVLALIAQQTIASAYRLEVAPFVSTWDMYSTTYASPQEYEAKAGLAYMIVAGFDDGRSEACRVDQQDAEILATRAPDGPLPDQVTRAIETCFRSGPPIKILSVEGRRRKVDWVRGQFAADEVRIPLGGPFPADAVLR